MPFSAIVTVEIVLYLSNDQNLPEDTMVRSASEIGKSNVRRSKNHERHVAHLLTAWAGVPFRRRRVEGRDTAVRAVEMVADVIPCVGDFYFTIEAKCGKGFSFDALMWSPKTCLFTEWYHQAAYDAKLLSDDKGYKIFPMVYFKPIPAWDWVAFPVSAMSILFDSCPAFPHLRTSVYHNLGPISCNISHSKKNKNMVALQLEDVIICRWKDFAKAVPPGMAFKGGLPVAKATSGGSSVRLPETNRDASSANDCEQPSTDPSTPTPT
jgi:hypothetical protein